MKRECNVRIVEFGSVKALVSIQYGDLELRGFRVIDHNGTGPWVAMPSREFRKNGERQFFNIIQIPDPAKKKSLTDWILAEYQEALRHDAGRDHGEGPDW